MLVRRTSVDLPASEFLRCAAASITTNATRIALITGHGSKAPGKSTCKVLKLGMESPRTETEELTFSASRIEEPSLFQFRGRSHLAALVDGKVMVFTAGGDNRGLRLIRPRDSNSGRPVTLCWLKCLVDGENAAWVACEAIGLPDGDKVYFWTIKEKDSDGSEIEAFASVTLPGEGRGAFADLLLDREQNLRAVLWLVGSRDGEERSFLSGPISAGSTAPSMLCIDSEFPAVNLIKLPEIPCSEIRESSGLPRCVGNSEEVFVLWLSQSAQTKRLQVLARTIRLKDNLVGPARVLDAGNRLTGEIGLSRDRDGRILAMWTVSGIKSDAGIVLAELTSVPEGVKSRNLPIASHAPRGNNDPSNTLHLVGNSEDCFEWSIDPGSRRFDLFHIESSGGTGH